MLGEGAGLATGAGAWPWIHVGTGTLEMIRRDRRVRMAVSSTRHPFRAGKQQAAKPPTTTLWPLRIRRTASAASTLLSRAVWVSAGPPLSFVAAAVTNSSSYANALTPVMSRPTISVCIVSVPS